MLQGLLITNNFVVELNINYQNVFVIWQQIVTTYSIMRKMGFVMRTNLFYVPPFDKYRANIDGMGEKAGREVISGKKTVLSGK